jgi:diguanylate cyclase (GGDEF)-like protein
MRTLKKKAEKPAPTLQESLSRELEVLSRLIRDFSCREQTFSQKVDKPCGERVVALARLCSDLPVEEWEQITRSPDFQQWIAFPINAEAYPFLVRLQERLDSLAYQSDHDPMTGVFNRRAFERYLELELQRAQRESGRLSLALLDVDNFKQVNDKYGHPCGDDVLNELARSLVKNKRTYDIAARLGGEEFALLLPGVGPQKAIATLERLLKVFRAQTFTCQGKTFGVTFSAGVASTNGSPGTKTTELIALADKALYQAKSAGKNRVVALQTTTEIEVLRSAMVHADEKKFLFSGIK